MGTVLFESYFKVMRHAASKNEKTIRKNFKTGVSYIGKKDKTLSCEEWLMRYLIVNKIRQGIETITCDVNLEVHFYFPKTIFFTKKGERNKNLIDLSNGYELVQDCLQNAKIILNDSQVCGHNRSKRLPINGTDYFLKIIITEFKEVANEYP